MNCTGCGVRRQTEDAFCSRCGQRLPPLLRPQRPRAIKAVLTLLGLCLAGAILDLSIGLGFGLKFGGSVFSTLESLGAGDPEALETARRLKAAMVVAVVMDLAIIAFVVWAMRAVEAARTVVRPLIVVKAGTEAVFTAAYHLLSGSPPDLDASVLLILVISVIPGLLIDAALLALLYWPASARRWFSGEAVMMPVTPSPFPAAAPHLRVPGPRPGHVPVPFVPVPRDSDEQEPVTVELAIPRRDSARHATPEPQP